MKAAIIIAFLLGLLLGLVLRRFVSSADPVSDLKATFWVDCNYAGQSVSLGPGSYKDATAIGLPNDSLSSLKVPKGLRVEIYQDNDFKGKSKVYHAGAEPLEDPCLLYTKMQGSKKWNDQVSSIIIKAV